ncbi:MAG TPA: hypothetical protein EYP87_05855 [Flavobacteriaceae bacterium]|nr:hypothetical protein [Flavobacteriaceae bacterium]
MNELIEVLKYTAPSLVTGAIAYYFFKEFAKSDVNLQNFLHLKEDKKFSKTLRLQAYERMTLFMERISPANLVVRIKAQNDNKQAYELSLIHTIEQEFEHNLTQQIYISSECWNVISTAKNTTIQLVIDAAKDLNVSNSDQLREAIINKVMNKQAPSDTALSFIKEEVKSLL